MNPDHPVHGWPLEYTHCYVLAAWRKFWALDPDVEDEQDNLTYARLCALQDFDFATTEET